MSRNLIIAGIVAVFAVCIVWQARSIAELRRQISAAQPEQTPIAIEKAAGTAAPELPSRSRPAFAAPRPPSASADNNLGERVTKLEDTVAQLTKASEYLMVRGQLPLAPDKILELQQKFLTPGGSDRDRLQALRLLRRNGAISDEVVQGTLSWLQTATNANLREDLLQQLGGATNAILKDPLVRLATTDTDADVRERAVESLRRFASDPQVEALLWNVVRNDTDGGVREEAEEALREGPMTEARAASLRARALDPSSSLDERLLAVRALRNGGDTAPEITAALAQFAQNTQDASERARVFGAFDGSTDPNMKLPLVYGLQDPDPGVRRQAADALSGYKGDPAIVDWLKYVAESDADPRVRREAQQALRDRR